MLSDWSVAQRNLANLWQVLMVNHAHVHGKHYQHIGHWAADVYQGEELVRIDAVRQCSTIVLF